MDTRIIEDQISLDEIREIAKEFYGDMVKGVADIAYEKRTPWLARLLQKGVWIY